MTTLERDISASYKEASQYSLDFKITLLFSMAISLKRIADVADEILEMQRADRENR